MKFAVVLALASSALVGASCPNSCSGHGTCGDNEVCSCHDNFGMSGQAGGDCSDRMCPYELAWVDNPDKSGLTHNYAECAAKGICDRSSGLCECFDGYEGKGCGRQVCENDCSGHGTCEYMNELSFGTVYGDYWDGLTKTEWGVGVGGIRPATDFSWDADRARTCVCDAGWSGLSCADRMCPVGNDILDTRSNTGTVAVNQKQMVVIFAGGTVDDSAGNPADDSDFAGKTFALKFTSKVNETFTTRPIKYVDDSSYAGLGTSIQDALLELPHKVVNGVTVTAAAHTFGNPAEVGFQFEIEFTGTSVEGNQHLIEVIVDPCQKAGCTPLVTGIVNEMLTQKNYTSYVKQSVSADFNSYECGRRGKCDVDTGECACFQGYTAEACTEMSSLV